MEPSTRPAGTDARADAVAGTICRGIARRWAILAVRGAAAILFGLLCLFWTNNSMVGLTIVWGAFAMADGILALAIGIRGRWWGMIVVGVLGILAGLAAFIAPEEVLLALVTFIAVWVILRGIFEIAAAVALRQEIANEWSLIGGGALSIIYGVALLAYPHLAITAGIWLIGAGAILTGIFWLVLAFRLKAMAYRASNALRR